MQGYGKPSVFHATVVIFLEFFAWGLLTSPTIEALKVAFPTGTFLKNGLIQGIKVRSVVGFHVIWTRYVWRKRLKMKERGYQPRVGSTIIEALL